MTVGCNIQTKLLAAVDRMFCHATAVSCRAYHGFAARHDTPAFMFRAAMALSSRHGLTGPGLLRD
jgi:hypothetical protein